jgi:hypothetical protein
LLPYGTPASELSGSDTSGQRVRPFGIRAQGDFLPETPARNESPAPFPSYPCMDRLPVPA